MLRKPLYETLHNFTDSISELTALLSSLTNHNLNNPDLSKTFKRTLFASEQLTQLLRVLEAERPTLHRIRPQRIITAIIKISELTSKLTRLSNLPEFCSPKISSPASPTSLLAIELTVQYLSVELAFFTRLENDIGRIRNPIFQEIHHLEQFENKLKFVELASVKERDDAPLFSRSAVARETPLELENEHQAHSAPTNTTWDTFIPVFFATDRKYAENSKPPHCEFLDRRGDNNLTYGIADVSIPPTHRRGQLERPFSLWKIQFKENVERHIVITSCNSLSIDDWKSNATDKLTEMKSKSALVFIHGFNVSFNDAIRQAAQIGFDLQLQSLITAYSWSSQGAVSNYAADEDSVRLTVPNLIDFINTLISIGITTIDVIAHSMGNRALIEALENLPNISPSLGEVVMAAPDIDATLFQKSVSKLHGKAKRYTLYGSASDKAIKLSKAVHAGYPRAGDGHKDIFVMAGIETIDATKVGEDLFGFGHSYFSDKPRVLSDLYYLIRESLPASRREGLCEEQLRNLRYWIFS